MEKGGVFKDKMQRGIVIDIQSNHVVVMTADGVFKKIPKKDPHIEIGKEVSFSREQAPRKRNWKVYISGAVAAVLALFFLFPIFFDNQAYAHTHVYVEIEPGIEMGLNEKLEVVKIRPLNQEANLLVGKVDWNKKPAKKVVVAYLQQAKMRGYLKKKDKIILSAINEKGSSTSTLRSIQTVIENDTQIGKKTMDLEVFTFPMPKEIKPKVQKTGLTPGKYGVWLLSKKEGKEISVEQIAESPISDLTEEIKSLEHPPTEREWIEIATEEEENQSTPDDSSQPTQQKPNTNPSQNQDKEPTDHSSEPLDEPVRKDGIKDLQPPLKIEDKKNDEDAQKQTKDQGGDDHSTMGSTGDLNSKTNHAAP